MKKGLTAVVVIAGITAIGAAGASSDKKDHNVVASTPHETSQPTTPEPDPIEPAEVHYQSTCDLNLSISGQSYLIAQSKLRNTGGMDAAVRVVAVFEQVGDEALKQRKTVHVQAGHSRRVNFNVPVSMEQIDRYQAAYGNNECRVHATMVG